MVSFKDMEDFDQQVTSYVYVLQEFIAKYDLPTEWFLEADHLAIKGADRTGYESMAAWAKPLSTQLSYIEMDHRRLATAHLKRPVKVGPFGEIMWLEIMEPRPEKVGKDVVGLEHMEFYFPDFAVIRAILDEEKISYTLQKNPGHAWVNIVLNDKGQELKLNNKLLSKTVTQELKRGEGILL